MKVIEMTILAITAIAALASAFAAWSLNKMQKDQNFFTERMAAIQAISDWSKNNTRAGANCMSMLIQYNQPNFKDFTNRNHLKLSPDQEKYASRCFVAYEGTFKYEENHILNDAEYSYISHQVLKQLNNYEGLALYWSELGEHPKQVICEQTKIKESEPYRTFEQLAKGTDWWNYPRLSEFLAQCK